MNSTTTTINHCPCGLTFEQAMSSTNSGMQLCQAVDNNNEKCNRKWADHPREQQLQLQQGN